MRDAWIVSLLSVLPRNAVARLMGASAATRVSSWGVRAFVRAYGVDLSEAEGDLSDYPTLDAFFTRRLRAGARPVDAEPGHLVSPVDGAVAWVGRCNDGRIEVAPGCPLSLAALLGEAVDGPRDVAVLYLSPRDYHRVHVPREGTLASWRYVPGTLWPVFPAAVARIPDLFARNERVVTRLDTDLGPHDMVLVGAFGVGRIEVVGLDAVSNLGRPGGEGTWSPALDVERGADLGAFHLGSTVVVVAPGGTWDWTVAEGDTVRVGRAIARRASAGSAI